MLDTNQELRLAGLKVTLPRVKILQLFHQSANIDQHLSAEDIYRELLGAGEDIGLATVYRVLAQFEGVGLVVRHNFGANHSVFELAKGDHHDHMICVDSGEIIEFVDPVIEKRQHELAQEKGYELVGRSLVLYAKKLADGSSVDDTDPQPEVR